MRVSIANAVITGVSAAGLVAEIKNPQSRDVTIHGIWVEQETLDTSEQLGIEIRRADGSTSGGTQVTPELLDPGDAAPGWFLLHSHTQPPTDGNQVIRSVFNTISGFVYEARPDTAIFLPGSSSGGANSLVIKLLEAPSQPIDIIVRVLGIEG